MEQFIPVRNHAHYLMPLIHDLISLALMLSAKKGKTTVHMVQMPFNWGFVHCTFLSRTMDILTPNLTAKIFPTLTHFIPFATLTITIICSDNTGAVFSFDNAELLAQAFASNFPSDDSSNIPSSPLQLHPPPPTSISFFQFT